MVDTLPDLDMESKFYRIVPNVFAISSVRYSVKQSKQV